MKTHIPSHAARGIKPRLNVSAVAGWAWIAFCMVVSVVAYAVSAHDPATFTADVGSEAVLANTLLKSGNPFVTSDFIYSTEVQVVGHHNILVLGLLLFPNNWVLARVFTLVVLMVMTVAGYRYCARSLEVWDGYQWVAGLLVLPFSIQYRDFFLYGMFYEMILAMTLASFGLCARASESKRQRIIQVAAAVILGFAFGIIGFRNVLLWFVPLFIAFVAIGILDVRQDTLLKRIRNVSSEMKASILKAGSLLVGSIMGFAVNVLWISKAVEFHSWSGISLKSFSLSEFMDLIASGFLWTWGYEGAARASSWRGLAALCALVTSVIMAFVIGVCLYRCRKLSSKQKTYLTFIGVSLLFAAAMYYLGGMPDPRYLLICFIPCVAMVPMVLKSKKDDVIVHKGITVVLCGLLFVQAMGYGFVSAYKHWRSGELYPKEKVVAWLVDEGHTTGYATFWNCNDLVEMSSGKLDMWSLLNNVGSNKWWTLENMRWLEEKRHAETNPSGEVFLVTTEREEEQLIEQGIILSEPTVTIDEYAIRIYESANALRAAFGVEA